MCYFQDNMIYVAWQHSSSLAGNKVCLLRVAKDEAGLSQFAVEVFLVFILYKHMYSQSVVLFLIFWSFKSSHICKMSFTVTGIMQIEALTLV